MANSEAALLIKLLADKSNLDVTLKDAEGSVINFDKKVKGLFGEMQSAVMGAFAGIAIGKVLGDAIMGADALATGLARLQVIVNNFNPSMKATTEEIKAWTEQTAVGTKFTHDELMPALEKAVVKVKDYATAQQIVKDAIKLSTLANIPLEEATNQLSLAHEGFSRGLMMTARQIGLNVKEGADYNDIINKINDGYKGMADVVAGDLSVAIKKAKDEVGDLLEETLVPSLPYIIQFVKGIELAFKVLWTSLLITGKYIGTITGALFLIAQGKFKEAKDQTIQSIKDAKAEIEGLFKGKTATSGTERTGLPPKPPADQEAAELAKMEEEIAKNEEKLRERKRREQEKTDAQSLKDTETFNKAVADADWDLQLQIMENWNKRLQTINDYLNKAASSLADVTTAWLNGEKDAWKNWADSLIQQIERVTLKKMFLMSLDSMFGGGTGFLGGLLDTLGVTKAAGMTGFPQIQVITADPATTVRFVNNAYAQATPKAQAQLYRNVQRGALQDYNR